MTAPSYRRAWAMVQAAATGDEDAATILLGTEPDADFVLGLVVGIASGFAHLAARAERVDVDDYLARHYLAENPALLAMEDQRATFLRNREGRS